MIRKLDIERNVGIFDKHTDDRVLLPFRRGKLSTYLST